MKDQSKTKHVLIQELASLKQKTVDLERTKSGHKRTASQWQVSLTDLAQDAVLMMDPTGCISLWNQAAERIFAYTSKEAIGQDLHQLLAPKSYRKAYRAAFSKFKKTGQGAVLDKTVELQACRKNGEEFPIELSLAAIHREDGWHALGIIRDITERKQADETLRESEERYRVLFEGSTHGILITDIGTGRFVDANLSICRMLGYSKPELLQLGIADIHPKELRDHVMSEINSQVQGGQPVSGAIPCLRKDNTVFYAEITGTSTIFHGRKYAVGFFMDITDRKRTEEALRNTERRLHTLVQAIPDLIWLKDKDGIYLSCNTMFERFLGVKQTDIIGKTDYDFVDRELADSFREHDRKAMAAGKITSNEEWITFADDGHRAFLDTIKTPMYDTQGTLIGVLGIGRDITNRRSVERIRKALGATVQAIAVIVEARDPYTAGHQRRVADLARSIATEMNLPDDQIDGIRMAATIHDLGKISVPAEILSKPTKLKKMEFDLIKEHSQSGYDILKDIDFPWPVAMIVLEHHERMDGSGYPRNMKGDEILMEARIVAVADVVEAMASHRPYRPGLGIDAALEEIEKNRGIFYDNTVANACLRLFREKGFQLERNKY
jgi:PAS domain S-box-containing protein